MKTIFTLIILAFSVSSFGQNANSYRIDVIPSVKEALQDYWLKNHETDTAGFKQYLMNNAEDFGATREQIANIKNPTLIGKTISGKNWNDVSRASQIKIKTIPWFHVTGIYEVDSILQTMPDSEINKIKDLASKFCLDRKSESHEYFIRRDAFISGFVFGKLITKK